MEAENINRYVAERIRVGVGQAAIKEELLAVGWTEDEAEAGYRAGLVAFGVPVPTEGNRPTLSRQASTVDVVINFFSFILLGIAATALGTLFFQVINLSFPDALDAMNMYSASQAASSIHYAIAALLVSFPLYFFAMRLWFRKFREDEGRSESRLSKWLTYLVLLVTAVTIVGDLITVIFTLLQGEITVRFFLKAVVILVIAGAIFGFYYLERRKIQYHKDIPRSTFQFLGRGMTALVVLGIIFGFFVSGSPATQRSRTLDQTRADNLSTVADCVKQYAQSLGALPNSLDDLRQSSQYSYCIAQANDPATGLAYDYRVVTPSRVEGAGRVGEFELCAAFDLASDQTANINIYGEGTLWYEHGAGKSCDTVTAQLLVPNYPAQTPTSIVK